jgi:hypothetical protein
VWSSENQLALPRGKLPLAAELLAMLPEELLRKKLAQLATELSAQLQTPQLAEQLPAQLVANLVHRLQLLKEKYERQAVTIYHLLLCAQALLGDVTKSSPEWNEDPTHTPSSKPNLPIRRRVLRYLPSVQGQKVMPVRAVNLRCSVCSHRVLLRKLHLLSMYARVYTQHGPPVELSQCSEVLHFASRAAGWRVTTGRGTRCSCKDNFTRPEKKDMYDKLLTRREQR